MSSADPGPRSAPVSLRPIPRPVRGRSLHKLLWKKLHLPRAWVHPLLSGAKHLASPAEVRLRRELAQSLDPSLAAGGIGGIPEERGFLLPATGAIPGMDAAVARSVELFEERRAHETGRVFNASKGGFLLSVLSGDDFAAHPELLRFMVGRPLLDAVSAYFGAVPLLAGAVIWWSPPNQSATSSQLYHLDNEDARQVKVFVNLFDTTPDHGPFTFLPADASRAAQSALREGRGRLGDDEVARLGGLAEQRSLVGPAGTAGLIDTSRCLHYGSRANREGRLVLVFQFLRFESPSESTFGFSRPPLLCGEGLDVHQQLALGVRAAM